MVLAPGTSAFLPASPAKKPAWVTYDSTRH
jgi:hypothetical protein